MICNKNSIILKKSLMENAWGIKLAAGDIEKDLTFAFQTYPDFITIDCRGGATGSSPWFFGTSLFKMCIDFFSFRGENNMYFFHSSRPLEIALRRFGFVSWIQVIPFRDTAILLLYSK